MIHVTKLESICLKTKYFKTAQQKQKDPKKKKKHPQKTTNNPPPPKKKRMLKHVQLSQLHFYKR